MTGEFFNESIDFSKEFLAGSVFGALATVAIFFAVVFIAAVYVYHSLAWYEIAKRKKHEKPWLAWIPFANISLILQMGGFHWAWVFLVLVPILGWIALFILSIISEWRIFESQNYPGWLSLASIIPRIGSLLYLIVIGVVAWYKRKPIKKRK